MTNGQWGNCLCCPHVSVWLLTLLQTDSRISDTSQDDSVFTNASYNTTDNAASEAASTCNDEEQDGLSVTDSGCDTNSGNKDNSMPPWLVAVSIQFNTILHLFPYWTVYMFNKKTILCSQLDFKKKGHFATGLDKACSRVPFFFYKRKTKYIIN